MATWTATFGVPTAPPVVESWYDRSDDGYDRVLHTLVTFPEVAEDQRGAREGSHDSFAEAIDDLVRVIARVSHINDPEYTPATDQVVVRFNVQGGNAFACAGWMTAEDAVGWLQESLVVRP